jgi:hypothetical protein
MDRRQIWIIEKIHGVAWKRAACSRCGWVSEMPGARGPKRGGTPVNTGAIAASFRVEVESGELSQRNVGRQTRQP